MNSLTFAAIYVLCLCCGTMQNTIQISQNTRVITYLINYGYLESLLYTKHDLRRALRQVQREHNFIVNGKITSEIINLVQYENNRQMVINYLKTFGYIQTTNPNPLNLTNAIKLLQENSGILNVTGSINTETINFINSQPHGYSEGLSS